MNRGETIEPVASVLPRRQGANSNNSFNAVAQNDENSYPADFRFLLSRILRNTSAFARACTSDFRFLLYFGERPHHAYIPRRYYGTAKVECVIVAEQNF